MNDKVECFVLSHTDYKENSLLVNVLTKEYGKLTFVANGVKKRRVRMLVVFYFIQK